MDKERMNYFEPGYPFIIVKKLTKEIISEAIQAYASDEAYWLKLYHFAGKVDAAVFNQLQAEHMDYLKEKENYFIFHLHHKYTHPYYLKPIYFHSRAF